MVVRSRPSKDWAPVHLWADVEATATTEALASLREVAGAAAEALGRLGTEAWGEDDRSALERAAEVLATCAAALGQAGAGGESGGGGDPWATAVALYVADRVLTDGPPTGAVATIRWLARETAVAAQGSERLASELGYFYEHLVTPGAVATAT